MCSAIRTDLQVALSARMDRRRRHCANSCLQSVGAWASALQLDGVVVEHMDYMDLLVI